MDAQLKAKWVEALRSRRFRQASGNLREKSSARHYSYCCLGVLCRVADAKWKEGRPVLNDRPMEQPGASYLSNYALKLFGLSQAKQELLAEKNDTGSSFPEIADYIEKNL